MSRERRKPDLRELVGVAVNTSALVFEPGYERALDRVAALGGAAARISTGADRAGLPRAAMEVETYRRSADMRLLMSKPGTPDERDQIAGELCPLLLHLREGGQLDCLPKAIQLFARWMRYRRTFADFDTDAHLVLLERFASRVMHEWLGDRCQRCGGTGKQERSRGGQWIRPRGSMQRNATFRACDICHGSGRARPSNGERARWLEISLEWYESERWEQRYTAAQLWLKRILNNRLQRPLTAELERRTKRT